MLTGHISRRAAGVWEVIQNLSNALSRDKGVSTSILGLQAPDSSAMFEKLVTSGCSAYKVSGPQSFGYSPGLSRALHSSDIDLLHNHGAWMYPSMVSYLWGKRHGKPVIISPHGMLDPWAVKNGRWKKRLVGALFETNHFKTASSFHALCTEEALGIKKYGIKQPVCVVPNGVHLPDLAQDKKAPDWITRQADGRNILLYLGRLHPKKGLESMIRAIHALKSERGEHFEDWVTFITGDYNCSYGQHLKALCAELQLQHNVIFTGPRFDKEKHEIYSAASGFILPSLSEGLPVSVLEAWAYSLPCVITPACHLADGYRREAAIRISYEVRDIAAGIHELFNMSICERKMMGINGRELVRDSYCWSKVSRQMLSVYLWALGGDKPSEVEIYD